MFPPSFTIMAAVFFLSPSGPTLDQSGASRDCDSNKLTSAVEYFNTDNYRRAETLFRQLITCPSQIGEEARKYLEKIDKREKCNPHYNNAQQNLVIGNKDRACQSISEMEKICPDHPKLRDLKRRANCCPESTAEDAADFDRADTLWKKGGTQNLQSALDILQKLKERNRCYQGIDAAIDGVQARIKEVQEKVAPVRQKEDAAPLKQAATKQQGAKSTDREAQGAGFSGTPSTVQQPAQSRSSTISQTAAANVQTEPAKPRDSVREKIEQARILGFDKNEYYQALRLLDEVLSSHPGRLNASNLREQIGGMIRSEKEALRKALRAFYSGQYEISVNQLRGLKNSSDTSPRAKAMIRFYLGAALLNTFYLNGETKPEIKSEALAYFQDLQVNFPDLSPPSEGISKRILDQFNTAKQVKGNR